MDRQITLYEEQLKLSSKSDQYKVIASLTSPFSLQQEYQQL